MGTLSLGVIHPHYIASCGGPRPLLAALNEVRSGVERSVAAVNAALAGMSSALDNTARLVFPPAEVLGLIGQYTFLVHREHATPVEQQHDQPARYQALVKPRAVLQIAGGCHGIMCRPAKDKACVFHGCSVAEQAAVISVSLIEFRYRWQVFELQRRLLAAELPGAKLFLSTGWEDCILILHNRDEQLFWRSFLALDLGSNRGCENVQTYLGFALPPAAKTGDCGPDSEHEQAGMTSGTTERVKPFADGFPLSEPDARAFLRDCCECTGRYDFRVVWNAQNAQQMKDVLCRLPATFWRELDRLSVTCERAIEMPQASGGKLDAGDAARSVPTRFTGDIGMLN